MDREIVGTPAANSEVASSPALEVTPSGLESLELFEHEIATYRRELPHWLQEGQAWKHVLIKGDDVLGIWDTQGEAIDAGRERFGLEPIYVKRIDPRDPERFSLLDACN